MQLEGFLFLIFFLIVFPLMVLFTNHNVYFILVSLALLIISFRNIYDLFSKSSLYDKVLNDDTDNVDDLYGIDIDRIEFAIFIAKKLFVILFALYCMILSYTLFQKAIAIFISIHAVRQIVIMIINTKNEEENSDNYFEKCMDFLASVGTIVLIVMVAYNKFNAIKLFGIMV